MAKPGEKLTKLSNQSSKTLNITRSQKSRESRKSLITKKSDENDDTQPNPNFFWGTDTFTLENGDKYSGEYCCHKTGIIWREGIGVYRTKDGHDYEGIWENDQLLSSPESKLIFPSQDRYEGSVIDGKYNGEGIYTFSDYLILKAQFKNNKPIGEVTLVDYDGHLWTGPAENNYALLLPRNIFYDSLPDWRGVGEEIIVEKYEDEDEEEIEEESEPSLEELETKYFKKSTKTKNDFELKKYSNCSHKRKNRSKKVQELISDELKYKQSSDVSISLLKMFLSKSWRKKSKPIQLITPTVDQEEPLQEENEVNDYAISEVELENFLLN